MKQTKRSLYQSWKDRELYSLLKRTNGKILMVRKKPKTRSGNKTKKVGAIYVNKRFIGKTIVVIPLTNKGGGYRC